jgi:4-diphosphocytidyl-2-C-methyl-D-erythritol kinase
MSGISFKLKSFAKINLHLRILGKRLDNFHEICTVFQTVSLHDDLEFSPDDKITLTCNKKNIPVDETNLIVKAARILIKKFEIKKGAKINLEKRIPAPGGLGGGSSNAAVSLVGLARLWGLELSLTDYTKFGKILGSDVPFFFYGGTALGTGRGTKIFPLEDYVEKYLLIVTPNLEISTAKAFNLLNAPHLTNEDSKSILKFCRDDALALFLRQSNLVNDFEKTVFVIAPEIKRVKEKLLRLGAKSSLMSGSGASVFAVFDSKEEIKYVYDELNRERNWSKFITQTVSQVDYLNSLKIGKKF